MPKTDEDINRTEDLSYHIVSGNNLNKRQDEAFTDWIEKDRDIRRMIRVGRRYGLGVLVYAVPVAYLLLNIVGIVLFDFQTLRNSWLAYLLFSCNMVLLVITFCQLRVKFRRMKEIFIFLCRGLLPKHPREVWRTYPSSAIDTQLSCFVQRGNTKDCHVSFSGEPYCKPYMVSSIRIRWEGDSLSQRKVRRHYRRFRRNFIVNTMMANAYHEKFASREGAQQREASNCAYGMLFVSGYLLEFLRKFYPVAEGQNRAARWRNAMNRGNTYRSADVDLHGADRVGIVILPQDHFKRTVAHNLIQQVASPDYFTLKNDTPHRFTLYIDDLCVVGEEVTDRDIFVQRRREDRKRAQKYELRIPVKRVFVGLPDPVPAEKWMFDHLERIGADRIVFLGGAEQNMALSYIINRHRWLDAGAQNERRLRIGFAENAFDNMDRLCRWSMLIGTEGLVYTTGAQIIAPDHEHQRRFANVAEMVSIRLDGQKVLIVYGYSAVASKMALVKYLLSLRSDREEDRLLIPDADAAVLDRQAILYRFELTAEGSARLKRDSVVLREKDDPLLVFWDRYNPLDHQEKDAAEAMCEIAVRTDLMEC